MSRLKDVPELARDGSNLSSVMQSVREVIQTFRGYRGDPLDQALTLRDLTLDTRRQLQGGGLLNGTAGGTTLVNPDAPVYEVDLTPPPTPEGLAASSGISHIYVECASPSYTQGHGHDRTVVYGIKWPDGAPAPVFASAVQLFQFQGPFGAYPSDPATRWALWIKWRSNDGVLSTDPAGGTNGVVTTTGQDVSLLLAALTGEITASELNSGLGARINLVDAPTTGLVDQLGVVKTTVNHPTTGVAATSASLDAVKLTVNNVTTGVAATATRVSSLETTVNTGPDRNTALRSSVNSEITARTDADTALATRATNLETSVNNGTTGLATKASVSQVATAKAEAIAASATVTDTISARLNTGDFAAVQVQSSANASSVTGLLAQYTVKLDVGGKVSGYGLASTGPTGTGSTFEVRADKFVIAAPTGSAAGYVPFSVLAVPTVIGGITLPAGVYAQNAFIQDAQITNAKIANLAVDDAKISTLSASKITAGSIGVGSFISSTAYTAGSAGWRINADGTAEFSGVVVRGTVYANAGQIGGNLIDASGVQSPGYAAGVSGWRLGTDGSFSAAQVSGNRIINLGATGTQSVLRVGDVLNIRADGSASYAGPLDADQVTTGTLRAGIIDVTKLIGSSTSFTSPGSGTFVVPANMTKLAISARGAGGGGGGSAASYCVSGSSGGGDSMEYWTSRKYGGSGGPGGRGGTYLAIFNVTPGQVVSFTVGANGGAGGGAAMYSSGSGGAGGTGGASTFTISGVTYAAGGGAGGGGGTSPPNPDPNGTTIGADGYAGGVGGGGGSGAAGAGSVGGNGGVSHKPTVNYGGPDGGGYWPGVAGAAGISGQVVFENYQANGLLSRSEWETLITHMNQRLTSWAWP